MAVPSVKAVQGTTAKSGDTLTKTYTSSGFGTPDVAIVFMTASTTAGTPSNHAEISIGFINSSTQRVAAFRAEHNAADGTSIAGRRTAVIMQVDPITDAFGPYGTGTLITDGLQIVYSAGFDDNFNISVVLIKGVANSSIDDLAMPNGAAGTYTDYTSMGFEPSLVLMCGLPDTTTLVSGTSLWFGAAHNASDGTVTQFAKDVYDRDLRGTTDDAGYLSDGDIGCVSGYSAVNWYGAASNFGANGFRITNTYGDGGSYRAIALSIELDDDDDVCIQHLDTKTTTGTQAYTGFGFQPSALIALNTNHGSWDNFTVGGCTWTFGVADADGTYSHGMSSEHDSATSDTQSNSYAGLSQVYSHAGTLVVEADLDSFDSDGITIDYTYIYSAVVREIGLIAFAGAAAATSVGLSSEADTAFGITPLKTKGLGLASESDSSLPAIPLRLINVGLASEIDSALPASSSKVFSVAISQETDSAFQLALSKILPVGLSQESDSAFSLLSSKSLSVGISQESDSAFSLSGLKVFDLGLSVETDSAFAIAASGATPVGLAQELDTALPIVIDRSLSVGISQETDSAFSVSAGRQLPIGLSVETDSALAVSIERSLLLSLAQEADSAFSVSSLRTLSVGLAQESDTAFPVTYGATVAIGLASEVDTAFLFSWSKSFPMGIAIELDSAFPVTQDIQLSLSQADIDAIAEAVYQKFLDNDCCDAGPILRRIL